MGVGVDVRVGGLGGPFFFLVRVTLVFFSVDGPFRRTQLFNQRARTGVFSFFLFVPTFSQKMTAPVSSHDPHTTKYTLDDETCSFEEGPYPRGARSSPLQVNFVARKFF